MGAGADIYISQHTDPYVNLGFEEYLCRVNNGEIAVFLWQNADTVVIGRNQNPWRECRVSQLLRCQGRLARRSTGGGAVYHDLGNLNFSFVFRTGSPKKELGYGIILDSVKSLGIRAFLTGRNDLAAEDGRKFSGSAFRHENGVFLHHGTLLISSDSGKMSRYLKPSFEKMESKGVKSASARVVNLSELNGAVSVEAMKQALIKSVSKLVGQPRMCYSVGNEESSAIARQYASDDWIYGTRLESGVTLSRRFDWGELELLLCVRDGRVQSAKVYTDALSTDLAENLEAAVTGGKFSPGHLSLMAGRLGGEYGSDISNWLKENAL